MSLEPVAVIVQKATSDWPRHPSNLLTPSVIVFQQSASRLAVSWNHQNQPDVRKQFLHAIAWFQSVLRIETHWDSSDSNVISPARISAITKSLKRLQDWHCDCDLPRIATFLEQITVSNRDSREFASVSDHMHTKEFMWVRFTSSGLCATKMSIIATRSHDEGEEEIRKK